MISAEDHQYGSIEGCHRSQGGFILGGRHLSSMATHPAWGTLLSIAARTLWGTKNRMNVSGLEGVSHQAQRLAGADHTR